MVRSGLFQPSANAPSLNKTALNIKEAKMEQSRRLKTANDITIKSCKRKLARRKISYGISRIVATLIRFLSKSM